jgi:Flp pilus assembly protein TadG
MVRGWIHLMAFHVRRIIDDARGGVALIGALSLTTLVGMGAFAVEATRGYAADTTNQRVADSAALAGALAYNVNSNTSEMTATAKAVVVAQGLPASAATVALVTDSATSKQLVRVTITTLGAAGARPGLHLGAQL